MITVTLNGTTMHTKGSLPALNTIFKDAVLIANDLSGTSLKKFLGSKVVLNIFPSVDTSVCATSVKTFNKEAASLEGVHVLCISKDLPFAQTRFCGSEGINNVIMLSDYLGYFGKVYDLELVDGPLQGLFARAVIVINEKGNIVHTELVSEITEEPDYKAALSHLK